MKRFVPAALVAALALSSCGQSMDSVDREMAKREAAESAEAATNLKAGDDFLARTAKEPGVVTLPSGLLYKVVASPDPTAPKPTVNDTVKVHYEGKLIDGSVFDSSIARGQPAEFPLNRVVEAWQIGIPLMHKGDTYMLYVPARLGYGEQASPDGRIPSNSVLVFQVQLLGINGK